MSTGAAHDTSIISVVGTDTQHLHFLANLSPPGGGPEVFTFIGSLIHEKSIAWKKAHEVEGWVTSMERSSTGRLYAVDMDGQLHFTDAAGAWTVRDLKCPDGLISLWVAADDELFIAGDHGERVRVSGSRLEAVQDPSGRRLNAVHGRSVDDVYMVGDKGLILHFQNGQWVEMEPPTNYNLLTVLCVSSDEVYVAGARGMLFRGKGRDWEQLKAPEINITSLAWYNGALYAAAGKDGIFRLEPHGLDKVKDVILYRLRVIGEHLFGVGGKFVARFDGKGWWGGPVNV